MKRVELWEPRMSYVYVVFHPAYGVPIYVGKGTGNRWKNHLRYSSNLLLRRVVRKYGSNLPIVIVRQQLTHNDAYKIEIAFIAAIGRVKDGGPLYNLTDGGDGVIGLEPESIEKMRQAKLGTKASEDTREKMSKAHTGLIRSPEHCKAQSIALLGVPKTKKHRKAMSVGAKRRDRSAGYSDEHATAIAKGVTAYWEQRRQLGLPLTHRTEEGNRKHSEALTLRHKIKRETRAAQAPTASAEVGKGVD